LNTYKATCDSFSDRLYRKGEIIEVSGGPPSKHFELLEGDEAIPDVESDIVPLSYAGMTLEQLHQLAKEKNVKVAHNAGKEKVIAALVAVE
jgi:hypothetical protein